MKGSYLKVLLRFFIHILGQLKWVILVVGLLLGMTGAILSTEQGLLAKLEGTFMFPVKLCFKKDRGKSFVIRQLQEALSGSSYKSIKYESASLNRKNNLKLLERILNRKDVDPLVVEGEPCVTVTLTASYQNPRSHISALINRLKRIPGLDFIVTPRLELSWQRNHLLFLGIRMISGWFIPLLFGVVILGLWWGSGLFWEKTAVVREVSLYFGATATFRYLPAILAVAIGGLIAGLIGEASQYLFLGISRGILFQELGMDLRPVVNRGILVWTGLAGGVGGGLLGLLRD